MLAAGLLAASGLWAADIDVPALLAEIDRQRSFGDQDFSAVLTMISEDPEDGVERLEVQQFRRDADDAFLILIRDPAVQRGPGLPPAGRQSVVL